jgi:hypothetical protein
VVAVLYVAAGQRYEPALWLMAGLMTIAALSYFASERLAQGRISQAAPSARSVLWRASKPSEARLPPLPNVTNDMGVR